MHKPLVIGIVGGIGGGKSTIAAMLRKSGFLIYDSDKEAKRIQNDDEDVRLKIVELFGNEAYKDGKLDRKKIAFIVFNDAVLLKKLSSIVHSAVLGDFVNWKNTHSSEEFLFLESAVLFESGLDKNVDTIILVTASEKERIRRVMLRDKVTEEHVKLRMNNQFPEIELRKRSDMVIDTESSNIDAEWIINKLRTVKTKKGTR